MSQPPPPGTPIAGYLYPPQVVYVPAPRNNFALAGFITSLSGFVINIGINGIAGIALSIVGLRESRRMADAGLAETGSGMAIAGIIIGAVQIVVSITSLVLTLAMMQWMLQVFQNYGLTVT